MPTFLRSCLSACIAFALMAPVAHGFAASFSVVPVRIFMKPGDKAMAVTLVNNDTTPVLLQAESFDWDQDELGNDKLTPSEDLILSPPIIQLAPNQQQVVRIAVLRAPDPDRQLTFRLLLREVPQEVSQKPGIALPVSLAVSLPVFMTPPNAEAKISCDLVKWTRPVPATMRATAPQLAARCTNSGNATRQIRQAKLQQGSQVITKSLGSSYVLPGRAVELPLAKAALPASGGTASIELDLDDGNVLSVNARLP